MHSYPFYSFIICREAKYRLTVHFFSFVMALFLAFLLGKSVSKIAGKSV